MDLPETDHVRPEDARPAGSPDECVYCHAKVGAQHNNGCSVISKSVVVRISYEVVATVPRDWDKGLISFFFSGGGSRCKNNDLEALAKWAAEHEDEACVCEVTVAEFVRDADQDDHDRMPRI